MDFLGMGWLEIMIVLIVALLVLGPDRVPEYARKAGRFIRQFRKITGGITKEITKAINLDEDEDITAGFKQDLDSIKESLEKDAAELKQTLDLEAKNVAESVADTTREAGEQLAKDTAEIKTTLAAEGQDLQKTITSEAREAARSLGADIPEEKAEEKPPAPTPPIYDFYQPDDNQ